MNPRVKVMAMASVGAVALLGAAYLGFVRLYAEPMADAQADLGRWRNASRAYERDLEAAGPVRSRLGDVAATTLGRTEEEVAHRFRSLLHETATLAGLNTITVTEGRTTPELNPATQVRLQGFARDQRRTSDFSVMNGDVRGVGSLEAVARMLELCETQAWIHRVSSFAVAPVGDAREQFEVRVSVATLILPDLAPAEAAAAAVTPLEPGAEAAWASIVSKNVFRVPDPPPVAPDPPVVVAPTPVAAAPAAPPPPPYHEWRLVGVMEGERGVSVVMSHPSGRSLSVAVGESVLDARLVRAGIETAVFMIGAEEFEVRLGQSLADRRPVD